MGCASCSSKCGADGTPRGCKSNGFCASGGCSKLEVFDWLAGMETLYNTDPFYYVEIRFKNTRKEFFKCPNELEIHQGEAVVVDAQFGYDVGTVSATGEIVKMLMDRKTHNIPDKELRKVLRKANQEEIDKWHEARSLENTTMLKARNIIHELKLDMKLGDVEYQGDGTKAIFYYIADERVDFRELIKILASSFKVRIEMKQIGARQEAGRIGGLGSCGRELCCSTWLTDFRSVSTSAARYQQLSINPLKLAGQCGKLKCCLNYELDAYMEAIKHFPSQDVALETAKGKAYHQKTDVFKGLMWYAFADDLNNFIALKPEDVKQIIQQNKQGKKPADLKQYEEIELKAPEPVVQDLALQDSLTRFDTAVKPKKKKKKKKPQQDRAPQANAPKPEPNNATQKAESQTKPQGSADRKPKKKFKPRGNKPKPSGNDQAS